MPWLQGSVPKGSRTGVGKGREKREEGLREVEDWDREPENGMLRTREGQGAGQGCREESGETEQKNRDREMEE